MKLRYMIDLIVADRGAPSWKYVPVGVWVQGRVPSDVEMYYLDRGRAGLLDRKGRGCLVVNCLVEAGATLLPADFPRIPPAVLPPMTGLSEITETGEYLPRRLRQGRSGAAEPFAR